MKFKRNLVLWILSIVFCLYWFLQVTFQVLNMSELFFVLYLLITAIIIIYLFPWIIKKYSIIKQTINQIKKQ